MNAVQRIIPLLTAAVFCLLASHAVSAQQLTLFNIDTSAYPVVKANFFAIDAFENQITTLKKEDVFVKENSISQQVLKVVNPAGAKPKQISLVLTIDISGSMETEYMKLAKSAATAIAKKIPLDVSECAVTSFDDISFVNTDFTRDRAKLLQTIQALTPAGGTDYNKGFTKADAGGLDILKNGLHEKVLIFLTDGYGDVNPSAIIQKAQGMGARVYVITLGMNAPDELKRVVKATQGAFYENVVSEQEINAIYLSILYRAQGLTASSIEWNSAATCGYSKKVLFGENSNSMRQAAMQYSVPPAHVVRLLSEAGTLTFNEKIKEVQVAVKAVNGDFIATAFNSSKAFFAIDATSFPRTIKKDSAVTFTVKHTGSLNEFASGRIELTSAGCQSAFIYFQYQPLTDKPVVNLIFPDGKEKLIAGQDTLIRWSTQNVTDPVNISLSFNAGKSWISVIDSSRDDLLNWKIPNMPGDNNLIKVEVLATQKKNTIESKVVYDGFKDIMNAYNLSPDGSRYITQTTTELFLHDTYTNTVINKIKNTIKKGYFIFSPDGRYIFIYDEGKPVRVYNGYTFELIEEWGVFKYTLSNFIEPYINNDLTQYVARDASGKLGIFHFKTGGIVKMVDFVKGREITDFTHNYIVSIDETNHHAWVWDYGKETRVLEISVPKEQIVNAEFNEDENVLLVYTWGADGSNQDFTAYDLSGKQLYSYKNSARAFMSLDTYGNYALCSVGNYPTLIDMNTGKVLHTYTLPGSVKFGWFVPFSNGKYVLFTSTSSDNVYMATSGIEDPENNLAADQSAAVFTILSAKPSVKKIVFPQVYAGNTKDSVITACIKNIVPAGIAIREMSIEGADAAAFRILNPVSSVGIAALSARDVEIRFAPVKTGLQQAVLKVITLNDTVRTSISGTGIIKPYALKLTELDMGTVEVGKTKDTTFSAVLTNIGTIPLNITSVRLTGPDKTQFKILSPTNVTIAAGASASIKLNFAPTQRGRTSTLIIIQTSNAVSPLKLPVYAEGISPRQYHVTFNFIDAVTKVSVAAAVTGMDRQSKKDITCIPLNNGKSSVSNVYADRIYVFSITKPGYKSVVDSINLLKGGTDPDINRIIELTPDVVTPAVTRTLTGNIFIKSTKSPLWAFISFYTIDKVLVKKIESDPDGLYTVSLPPGKYSMHVEKEGYVSEIAVVEILDVKQNQTKDFELSPIKVGETISLPNVYFARGGTALLESSNESLDQLYTMLKDNPTMRIELLGYTDNQGDPKLNILLSEQRVAAIKDYLVAKGIAGDRITGKGYGGAKPIASNATEETRQLNRRVEFVIVSK
ncbi:MAG: OmpA family protein [Cytophaga sp.]|uniref:OmpA family protein n=1 Tax=Cytophaga sp. TaxID=29535 RepID=UPI003F7E24EB